jgi:hypothetical protein
LVRRREGGRGGKGREGKGREGGAGTVEGTVEGILFVIAVVINLTT